MIKMPNSLEVRPSPPKRSGTRRSVRSLGDVIAVTAGLLAVIPVGLAAALAVRPASGELDRRALANEVLEGALE